MEQNNGNGKTIVQGYVLSRNNAVVDVGGGYYFKVTNSGANAVVLNFGQVGILANLAPGANYEFTAGNPFFPFTANTKLEVNFSAGASIVNVIVAYTRYE